MSVVLIRPRNKTIPRGVVSTQYPINLGYLASWLKKNRVDVRLLDLEVEALDDSGLISFVKRINPVIVGISCMTHVVIAGHNIARLIKKNFPHIKIVVGGVHPTAVPERTLEEFPFFGIVVKGEGENSLLELYNTLVSAGDLSKVKGLVYRDSKANLVDTGPRDVIENLDELIFPDRDLLSIDLYKRTHTSRAFSRLDRNISEIITARGCPYSCIFCASKVVFGRRVRYRSVENIIAEMEECIIKYNTDHFSILDDTFTFRRDILYPVSDYLRTKGVSWDCFTRVDKIDSEMVDKLVGSGCEKISFGVESGSERILALIGKGITVKQVKEASALCRRAGLRYLEMTFMLGNHPLETIEDVRATVDLIMEINPDLIAFSLTAPFPGTELNRLMKEGGYLDTEKWDEFILYGGTPSWRFENLSINELKNIQKKVINKFYLRPRYMLRQIKKIKRPKEFLYWTRVALNMVRGV